MMILLHHHPTPHLPHFLRLSPPPTRLLTVSTLAAMGISNYASQDGEFRRKPTTFRNQIEIGGRYPPEKDRYHLFVSWACPWGTITTNKTNVACRTLIVRELK